MSNLIHLNMKAEPSVVNDASRIVKRTTVHAFSGNTVTVTDPAGKWKRFLTDARGNLWQVNEPNPNGGVDYITYYTYSTLNHLLTVSMTRPNVPADGTNVTQTRTFLYKSDQRLQSVTNPESGTTSYTYNPDGTMATKTDAKNQVISYFYDTMGRLTQVKNGNVILRTLTYDANPDDQGNNYGTYLLGRIARIDYGVGNSAPAAAGNAWTELYSYDQAGGMLKKRLALGRAELHPGSLEATCTYDDEGRMTSIKYPDFQYDPATASGPTGPTYTYTYDQMGRPLTLTGGAYVSGVTYGPAGELTSINGETRTYNEQKQLTGINVPGLGSITYSFSSTNNNGRITGMTNTITGESVTYAYDSLNRLISASAGGHWGLSFSYDGFGNRLSQNVTAGSAPTIQQSYDMTTNRLQGQYYDANGNMGGISWDVENRLLQIQGQTAPYSTDTYDYGIDNKRIYKQTYLQSGNPEEVYFYVAGRKIATYTLAYLDITGDGYPTILFTQPKYNVYFGSRLMIANGQTVVLDRLGSVVWDGAPHSYFPYGEERTPTANNKDKFATYFRDASTGLDYADQRFYGSIDGRFTSPDPSMENVDYSDSTSWNAYAYVNGDPVNFNDPDGLVACGDLINAANGKSLNTIMTTYNDLGYLAQTIWHEGGPLWKTDSTNVNNFVKQQAYIATALENRYDIANGKLTAYTATGGTVNPAAFGGPGTSLTSVILQAAGNDQSWGIYSGGKLESDSLSSLKTVMKTDVSVGTQVVLPSGGSVNAECFAALSAATEALLAQGGARFEPNGVILTYWNLATNSSPDRRNTQTVAPVSLNGDTFYGYFTTQQPKPVRPPPPHRPGRLPL